MVYAKHLAYRGLGFHAWPTKPSPMSPTISFPRFIDKVYNACVVSTQLLGYLSLRSSSRTLNPRPMVKSAA